jgi:membrane-associated phospholipid phosphatase
MAVIVWLFAANRWRWVSVALVMVPPLVGIARMYLGVHHPSDVIASLVFISAWLVVVGAVVLRVEPPKSTGSYSDAPSGANPDPSA